MTLRVGGNGDGTISMWFRTRGDDLYFPTGEARAVEDGFCA
jgi:hypothetical protein